MTSGIKIRKLISDNYRDLSVSSALGYCTKPSSTIPQRSNQELCPCTCLCKSHNFAPLRPLLVLMFLSTVPFSCATQTHLWIRQLQIQIGLALRSFEERKKCEANGGRRNIFRRRVNTINIKFQLLISYNGSISCRHII